MAFPAYGTTVPTLSAWQFSFLGYTFGFNQAFELKKIEGLDLPAVRTGDAGRPRDHGLFVGLDVMGGREVTFTGQLHQKSGTFQEAIEALAKATVPTFGVVQEPLFGNVPGYGTIATLVRVRKRNIPVDIQYTLGQLAEVAVMFAASDPRWYAQPTQQLTVSPPTTIPGFAFPLTFPLVFGGGSSAGALSITNAGNIDVRPILIVEGPSVNPSITNGTAAGNPNLTFNLTLNAGDVLTIDTDLHTATLVTSGSTIGSTRLYTLALGSKWFTLEANKTTTIQFLSSSGEGKLAVQWASAYVSGV